MKDHLKRSSNWQYVINTAGEAYPLRSQREMIHILRLYNGSNDIEGIYGRRNTVIMNRYRNEYVETSHPRTLRRTHRKNPEPPHDISIGLSYPKFIIDYCYWFVIFIAYILLFLFVCFIIYILEP